ncbi:MAG TPA: hypothetical protein VMW38_08215 [Terriglobia bacterium]|nr:hypothetical protein [Terriglobia bacterium]
MFPIKGNGKQWRRWWRIGGAVALVYVVLSCALFVAMKKPPLQFAAVMSRIPMISMMVFPFESLWNIARAGDLKVGDPAPDFRLKRYDDSTWVQLSSFRGDRPVVLIFGSYT